MQSIEFVLQKPEKKTRQIACFKGMEAQNFSIFAVTSNFKIEWYRLAFHQNYSDVFVHL